MPLRASLPRVALLCGLTCLALLLGSGAALGADKSQADALFEEGRVLLDKGQVEEACQKFADSMRLDPSVGALVNLARCHEVQGKTATAYGEYRSAATKADAEGQAKRAQAARALAKKLEPGLSRLTVRAERWIDGMTIRLDDMPLGPDSLGVPLPVDPGDHRVEARAPGHRTWSTSVTIGPKGDKQNLEVPPLEEGQDPDDSAAAGDGANDGSASNPGPQAVRPGDGAPATGDTTEEGSFWGAQRIAGLAIGVVGVAGLVIGGVYGGQASSQWDDALTYCQDGDTSRCSAEAGPLSEDASTSATISTVGLIAGGVLLAGGVVLFLTAPSDDAADDSSQSDEAAVRVRLRASAAPGAGFTFLEGLF